MKESDQKESKESRKDKNNENEATVIDISGKNSFYSQEWAYSQSSSSGEDTAKLEKDKEKDVDVDDPFGFEVFKPPKPVPQSTCGVTPFKINPKAGSISSGERKDDMSKKDDKIRSKSVRDGDAKATVGDFLPALKPESAGKKKISLLTANTEKRLDRDRDRDRVSERERIKLGGHAVTVNPMLTSTDKESSSRSIPLPSSDVSEASYEKKKKIKLADIASGGFESTQLLDLGASPAFGMVQRREELLAATRKREADKASKKSLGALAHSDLADLLTRPARSSSSGSINRGDRERGRRRTGIASTTIDGKSSLNAEVTRAITEANSSPKANSKTAHIHSNINSTSANTAANRQHVGSSTDPSGGTQSTSRRYFMLELVDPQLNFLDTKSHSSLIMVAGRSTLQGQRFVISSMCFTRGPLQLVVQH